MVNASKKNFSQLPASRYLESRTRSTQRCRQANEGKSGLEAERVRFLGALHSLRLKKKLAAEIQQETHFLSNEEEQKSIEDYVERETAGTRKRVADEEAAVQQVPQDMKHAEIAGLTTKEPKKMFEEMMVANGDSLIDVANSDHGEDGEDEDSEEAEQGKVSRDDKPGWVMGTISQKVPQRMEMFWQKQM